MFNPNLEPDFDKLSDEEVFNFLNNNCQSYNILSKDEYKKLRDELRVSGRICLASTLCFYIVLFVVFLMALGTLALLIISTKPIDWSYNLIFLSVCIMFLVISYFLAQKFVKKIKMTLKSNNISFYSSLKSFNEIKFDDYLNVLYVARNNPIVKLKIKEIISKRSNKISEFDYEQLQIENYILAYRISGVKLKNKSEILEELSS